MPQSSDLSVTDSLNVILNMANNGGEFLCEIYNCQLIRKLRMAARYGSYMIEGNDNLLEDNFGYNITIMMLYVFLYPSIVKSVQKKV